MQARGSHPLYNLIMQADFMKFSRQPHDRMSEGMSLALILLALQAALSQPVQPFHEAGRIRLCIEAKKILWSKSLDAQILCIWQRDMQKCEGGLIAASKDM